MLSLQSGEQDWPRLATYVDGDGSSGGGGGSGGGAEQQGRRGKAANPKRDATSMY